MQDGRFGALMEVELVNDGPVWPCHEQMNTCLPIGRFRGWHWLWFWTHTLVLRLMSAGPGMISRGMTIENCVVEVRRMTVHGQVTMQIEYPEPPSQKKS